MALTASSVLHYWSSRYGPVPIIGGKPVHTRSSAARTADQRGVIYAPIINTPRPAWDTIDGERRTTMLLELARTNSILYSNDFSNAAWVKDASVTVATGIDDPAGGTTACRLTSSAGIQDTTQTLSAGASITRTPSMWIRRKTGTGNIQLKDGGGGGFTTMAVTSSWARYSGAVGIAGTARQVAVRIVTSGDAIDVWQGQLDDGDFATSEIPTTTAAVTRSADSFYWDFPPLPQAMMIYLRFIEKGLALSDAFPLAIGKSDNTAAQLKIQPASVPGPYGLYHNTGTSVSSYATGTPALGDTVEFLGILFSDGSVQGVQSINGAAVTAGTQSGVKTLAASWSDTKVWLNSLGTAFAGAGRYAEVKIVKYADVVGATAQARMDELRAFEIGASGEVLS